MLPDIMPAVSEAAKTEATPVLEGREKRKGHDLRDHRVELDALRGVAIIGVVACHITARWNNNGLGGPLPVPLLGVDALELLQFGSFGVSLFFLLSGYLLAWTEGERVRRSGRDGYSLRSYAARRALRLVPAYYVSIVIVLLVWPIRASKASVEAVLWHVSFLHSFSFDYGRTLDGVYWSLTAEVVFYLLLPLLVLRMPGFRARVALFAVLFAVSLGTRIYMTQAGFAPPDPYPTDPGFRYLYYLPSTQLYLFIVGMLLRTMVERLSRPSPKLALISFGLFAGSVAVIAGFPYLVAPHGYTMQGPLAMLVDLALVAFFAAALLGSPLLRRVLRFGPLVGIGAISYSLFLLHNTVLVLFVIYFGRHVVALGEFMNGVTAPLGGWASGASSWLTFLAFACCIFGIACGISYLSYRFVETPFLRRKPK